MRPPRTDPVARVRLPSGLLTGLGGRRGAHAPVAPSGRSGLAALAPVVLLLGLPLVVAVLRQASCVQHGWEGRAPVWRMCAAPVTSSLVEQDAGRGVLAYLTGDVPLDVPVLRGVTTTVIASLTPGGGLTGQRTWLVLWVAVAAVLLAGLVVLVATVRDHPAADPVALALSPVLALSVLLSVQLVPVALAVVAVWARSRRRPEVAGAAAGLALLGAWPAVVVLAALAVSPPDGVRAAGRRLAGGATVAVLVVVGPVAALDLDVLLRPVRTWWSGGAAAGSPWFVPELARHPLGSSTVALLSLLGTVAAVALVVVLARRRPAPAMSDLVLVGLVVLLVTAPAFPVGTALWLVPFVAMSGVRWRDHLVWAGAEAVHLVAMFGWLMAASDPSHGLPAGWYATALALRLLAVGRLGWVVWARASWGEAPWAGTLDRLPTRPVDNSTGGVGGNAYPPVTEGP